MDWNIKNQTKPNQTKPNQTTLNQLKPNQTLFPFNFKFSAISYPIELKLGMYAKWYLSNGLKHKKNQQNQSKPNKTR